MYHFKPPQIYRLGPVIPFLKNMYHGEYMFNSFYDEIMKLNEKVLIFADISCKYMQISGHSRY